MIPTEAEMTAMAAFLLSEKKRHQEDIDMIDHKLLMLAKKGVVADEAAPWFTEEDILAGPKTEYQVEYRVNNTSPLGGYYRVYNLRPPEEFDGTGTA